MHKIIKFLFLSFLSASLYAQTPLDAFKKFNKENDIEKIIEFIPAWELKNSNDPDLYTSAFNFYFAAAQQELITISKEPRNNQTFEITDNEGNPSGFYSTNLSYNSKYLDSAFKYINRGIYLFPNRLDMRFGKCYVQQQIGDYEEFTDEVISTIAYSNIIKNRWLWSENKNLPDAEKFMLSTVLTYLKQLYDTENDDLLTNMISIGDSTLKYYPHNIEILSTTAVASLLTNNFEKAINYLKQAEAINPQDFIVLNNIARAYKLNNDKVNALKYYKLTEKYGDIEAKKTAQQEIAELNNK